MDIISELKWRGLLQDYVPEIDKFLQTKPANAYTGFDPTATSLHVGNLVQIATMRHLQMAGHKPIALVGGATGMVGDPSGKSKERNLLDIDALQVNQTAIKLQLERLIDFSDNKTGAVMVNNFDWFGEMNFLAFLRDVGKHISVNYMMAKESVKKRLETGMSYTEFSYQLIQAYDFYKLFKYQNCHIQFGGADQWGNITTGIELIRRISGAEAYAFTTPLITKADGTKFGKTEDGNVWLDADKTSPYHFYQFWLNTSDEDAEKYIKIFTFLNQKEIQAIIAAHQQAPHLRTLQKKLAKEVTVWVHSKEALNSAKETSEILFGNSGTTQEIQKLSVQQIKDAFQGVPQFKIAQNALADGINIIDLLAVKTNIFNSKGEARRMLNSNAVSINREKQTADSKIDAKQLINNRALLVQKGKKNYYLILVAN